MAGRQLHDADRPGEERHHRPEVGDGRGRSVAGSSSSGSEAVRHQPRPDGVVDGHAPSEEAAARGDVAARHLDPGRGERRERGLEPLDLGGGPIAASSAAWRWVQTPARRAPPDAAIAWAAATAPSTGDAAAPQPGLDLELDVERRPAAARRRGRVGEQARSSAGSPAATATRRSAARRRERRRHRDRAPSAGHRRRRPAAPAPRRASRRTARRRPPRPAPGRPGPSRGRRRRP